MKNKLILSLAFGLSVASSLTAATVDVYLTGSTAFRKNCYDAAKTLFATAPTIYYGDAAHGGANSGWNNGTASWVMTGTPSSMLTAIGSGNTLVIHGLFTGSVQGFQTVLDSTPLTFAQPVGTANGLASAYVTNSPTIGFSDASGTVTPYPATGNYIEENVAVQPFVYCKSSGTSPAMANIDNVTYEMAAFGIPNGYLPLSAWTHKLADTNTPIYMMQRTADSGTRRVETAENGFDFGATVGINIYDQTNDVFYVPTVTATTDKGGPYTSGNGIVGPAGLNNVNLNWGYGYVGGGDIAGSLGVAKPNNNAIGFLSMGDAKGITGVNWANVVSFNGAWPTAAGAGLHGNTGTNDFSPITTGFYPCWGLEVLIHPIDPSLIADQNITADQLGDQYTAGTFLGVFNNHQSGAPLVGSIDATIENSKAAGATAIRISDMLSNRQSVGTKISPY